MRMSGAGSGLHAAGMAAAHRTAALALCKKARRQQAAQAKLHEWFHGRLHSKLSSKDNK
jgi:hypothetical protein